MTSAQVGQTGMDMDPERLKRVTEAADWLVRLAAPDVSASLIPVLAYAQRVMKASSKILSRL